MTAEMQEQGRFETLSRVALAGLAVGVFLAYDLGTRSYVLPKWLFLYAAAIAALCWGGWRALRHRHVTFDLIDGLALLVLLYAAATLTWTPDGGTGMLGLIKLSVAGIVFTALRRMPREQLDLVVPFAAMAASAVILIRIVSGEARYGGFGNESFVAEFLLLALPFAGLWWVQRDTFERWLAPVVIAGALAYLFGFREYTFSKIVFVGGPVILLAWFVIAVRSHLTPKRIALIAGFFVLLAGISVTLALGRYGTLTSIQTRLELTYNTLSMWLAKPVLGHGLGSFDFVYPYFMGAYQNAFPNIPFSTISEMMNFAGAAHNEPAQLLAELGVVGFALSAVFIFVAIVQARPWRTNDPLTLAALAQLAVTASVVGITFVLQNPATLLLTMTALAITCHRDRVQAENRRAWAFKVPWFAGVPAAGVAVFFALVLATAGLRDAMAHRLYAEASQFLIKEPARAYALNSAAVEAFPAYPQARRQLWVSFVQWVESGQQVTLPPDSHDDIFALSASTGPAAPGLLIPLIYYFILTDQDQARSQEIEALFTDLKRRAGRLPDIYIIEALYGLKAGDFERTSSAIAAAEARVSGQDPALQQFQAAKVEALKSELAKRRLAVPEEESSLSP